MLRLICLAETAEFEIKLEDVQPTKLTGGWLEIVDPTKEVLQQVSTALEIPIGFLSLPESKNVVNLRLEQDYCVINFLIIREIFGAKKINPVIVVISKNYLITIAKSEDQKIIDRAKERLDKFRVDQPSIAAFYVLDEIVADHFIH